MSVFLRDRRGRFTVPLPIGTRAFLSRDGRTPESQERPAYECGHYICVGVGPKGIVQVVPADASITGGHQSNFYVRGQHAMKISHVKPLSPHSLKKLARRMKAAVRSDIKHNERHWNAYYGVANEYANLLNIAAELKAQRRF